MGRGLYTSCPRFADGSDRDEEDARHYCELSDSRVKLPRTIGRTRTGIRVYERHSCLLEFGLRTTQDLFCMSCRWAKDVACIRRRRVMEERCGRIDEVMMVDSSRSFVLSTPPSTHSTPSVKHPYHARPTLRGFTEASTCQRLPEIIPWGEKEHVSPLYQNPPLPPSDQASSSPLTPLSFRSCCTTP